MSGDKLRQFRKPADVLGARRWADRTPHAPMNERFIVNVCRCDTDASRRRVHWGRVTRLANAAYSLQPTRFAPNDANQRDRRWGWAGAVAL